MYTIQYKDLNSAGIVSMFLSGVFCHNVRTEKFSCRKESSQKAGVAGRNRSPQKAGVAGKNPFPQRAGMAGRNPSPRKEEVA